MKSWKEVIDGIRKAVMASEVREDIAQMGEYVEQFANTAGENIQKAIDPTLSVSGKAADAAKVGTSLAEETTRAKAAEEENARGIGHLKEDLTETVGGLTKTVGDLKIDLYGTKKVIKTESLTTEGGYVTKNFSTPIPTNAKITSVSNAEYLYFKTENGSLIAKDDMTFPYSVEVSLVGARTNKPDNVTVKYEYGENVDGDLDKNRKIIKVYSTDTETTIFEKMLSAYTNGYTDVYFEKSTYTLSSIYDNIITNYPDMAKGLPIGNNCRYYFNGSTIISNVSPNGYSERRNILDCQSEANTYEVNECILINNGGRYCIHDEGSGDLTPYAHLYRNVKMVYNHTDSTPDNGARAFGCGVGHKATIIFENCQFINNNQNTVSIAIHNVPTRKDSVVFNLTMINSYINKYTIDLANFDKAQDTLEFYLFGNLWELDFTDNTPHTIKNNNHVIAE